MVEQLLTSVINDVNTLKVRFSASPICLTPYTSAQADALVVRKDVQDHEERSAAASTPPVAPDPGRCDDCRLTRNA